MKWNNEELKESSKLLNMSFQNVFTKESMCEPPKREMSQIKKWEIEVNREEIHEIVGELKDRKAAGSHVE